MVHTHTDTDTCRRWFIAGYASIHTYTHIDTLAHTHRYRNPQEMLDCRVCRVRIHRFEYTHMQAYIHAHSRRYTYRCRNLQEMLDCRGCRVCIHRFKYTHRQV